MTTPHPILDQLTQAVFSKNPDRVNELFQEETLTELDHSMIVSALIQGLESARKELGDMTASVAEFLLSVDAMRRGFDYLKNLAPEGLARPTAVIGVVKGDVHDLGANIIAGVMEALGYDVKNLGQDTDADQFLNELKQSNASILGLSSMMSTTISDMKEIITRCKREFPDVKILVGGACLDENLAKAMGSDGYAESAVQLPDTVKKIEKQIDPNKTKRKYTDYDRKIQVIES